MKRNIITASAIGILSLSIFSCNNQDSSPTIATEQTTEVKSADTPSSGGKIDSLVIQPEAPKVIEETKKKVDTLSATRNIKSTSPKAEAPKADAIDQAVIDEGKELISKSDCLACHKLQDKLVGPSYADVAAKYSYSKSTVQNLAGKIVSGGSGVWGQVPMTPHPAITPENAQKMVTYILSLRK